jgi:hypothetical protein
VCYTGYIDGGQHVGKGPVAAQHFSMSHSKSEAAYEETPSHSHETPSDSQVCRTHTPVVWFDAPLSKTTVGANGNQILAIALTLEVEKVTNKTYLFLLIKY